VTCRDCGRPLTEKEQDHRLVGACYDCHAKQPRCWLCGERGHRPVDCRREKDLIAAMKQTADENDREGLRWCCGSGDYRI
jgi:hypothetical protein